MSKLFACWTMLMIVTVTACAPTGPFLRTEDPGARPVPPVPYEGDYKAESNKLPGDWDWQVGDWYNPDGVN